MREGGTRGRRSGRAPNPAADEPTLSEPSGPRVGAAPQVDGAGTDPGQAFFDALPDGVVVSEVDGRIVVVNAVLEELTGFASDELVGKGLGFLVADPDRVGQLLEQASAGAAGRAARPMGGGIELFLRRKDGPHVPVDAAVGTLRLAGRGLMLSTVREATQRIAAAATAREDISDRRLAQERLEAANEVARTILDNRPLDEVFRTIVTCSRGLVAASNATIVTPVEGDEDTLVVRVAEGGNAAQLQGRHFPAGDSISGQVMRIRQPLLLEDVSTDPRAVQPVVQLAVVGPALFAPLAVGDRAFGTLLVGRPLGAPPFGQEELRVIELFASQAAVALEHARYEQERHRLVVLEDRERIGRELHDGAIQQLFATGMKLQSALGAIDGAGATRVDEAVDEIDQVIKDLRGYILGLRTEDDESHEAVAALYRLASELEEAVGLVTVVDVEPDALANVGGPHDVVQFVREALSNVRRHAQASTCRVRIVSVAGGVLVEVDDDGVGFDLDACSGVGDGLPNLHERATALGGELELDTAPGTGTRLRVLVAR